MCKHIKIKTRIKELCNEVKNLRQELQNCCPHFIVKEKKTYQNGHVIIYKCTECSLLVSSYDGCMKVFTDMERIYLSQEESK